MWQSRGDSPITGVHSYMTRHKEQFQMTTNYLIKCLFFSLIWAFFLSSAQVSARADEILVSAAASLTDVLKEMGKAYQSKSKHKLLLTLGPSNFLARQIDEGAPADMFFSADLAQMDLLEKNGRLEPG